MKTRYLFTAGTTVLGACLALISEQLLHGGMAVALLPLLVTVLTVAIYAGTPASVACAAFSLALTLLGEQVLDPSGSVGPLGILAVFGLCCATVIGLTAQAAASAARRVDFQAAAAAAAAAAQLSKLSHELRSPLTAVLGWVQVLRAQTPPAQFVHGLEVIERNVRAQTRILEEALGAARRADEAESPREPAESSEPTEPAEPPIPRSPGE